MATAGGGEDRPPRAGFVVSMNRRLGRMHLATATAVLVTVAVVAAVSLHAVLAALGAYPADWEVLTGAAIATAVVATPIVVHAQSIIRELVASRQALRLMTDKLAWALHNAEQANQAKSAFLATMSHELRTPLNAIIGFSDVMAHQRLGAMSDPRYRDYAADINASGTHLLEIINDILDIAKIESGQSIIEEDEPISIVTVLEAACTMVRPMADRAGVPLRTRRPSVEVRLVGVERMIRQILVNILSNAVKFTPAGGSVTLDVVPRYNGWLIIAVTDTGIGMSAEETRIALTAFGQVDSPQNRRHGGTGLGLPLAKSMMELHGGRLTVISAPGEGTTIELRFPPNRVRFQREPATGAEVAGTEAEVGTDVRGRTVP
jgi:two-component system, cell cycle sensor histidine kinase PleC